MIGKDLSRWGGTRARLIRSRGDGLLVAVADCIDSLPLHSLGDGYRRKCSGMSRSMVWERKNRLLREGYRTVLERRVGGSVQRSRLDVR